MSGINVLLTKIAQGGGMATSNNFAVGIDVPSGVTSLRLKPNDTGVGGRIIILCDEVSLPGVQASTGQITGLHQGSPVINYPTGKVYNDLQLSFMCDADMSALKFLQDWFSYIFDTTGTTESGVQVNKLRYPNEYQGKLTISKTERNKNTDGGSGSIEYQLMKAWPYAIDSVPLSYGSSQLVKVTANFYYRYWTSTKYDQAKTRAPGGSTVTS